jgi:ligand-binding sensor domain-containing protein
LINKKAIIIYLLLLSGFCQAQYIFSNFQKQNGLGNNEVFCSYKDNDGFMWFGTANGLNRYDGSGFKIYNRQNKNAAAVTSILKRDNNEMWLGTKNGLYIFNKQFESFTAISFPDDLNKEPLNTGVHKLFFDDRQRLWIVAYNELFLLSENKAVRVSAAYPSANVFKNGNLFPPAIIADL